jgi:hypothetical protein
MKFLPLLAFILTPWFSQVALAAPPDLSKLSSLEVLKLGLNKVEKIEGKCYTVKHDFCEVGSDPRNCVGNDIMEQKTNAKLEAMKFVLTSRTRDASNKDTLIYKAVPISPKQKEEDLYILRNEKTPSPIRFFVTLQETACSLPAEPHVPIPSPGQTMKPKSELPTHSTEKNGTSQPSDSVAIPATGESQQKAALKFLLQGTSKDPNR